MLAGPQASEATDRAKRRKKRKRRARGQCCKPRPMSITIFNWSTRDVIVEHGEVKPSPCCRKLATVRVAPGAAHVLNARTTWAYAWIDNRFWFDFQNPIVGFPAARVALGGQYLGGTCCKPQGTERRQFEMRGSAPLNAFTVWMDGRRFGGHRISDTNYKRMAISIEN